MSEYIVGLTGGIGSGKTAVADRFVAHGVELVDTDAIAHELTAPAGAAMPALRAAFGDPVVQGDGALNRAAMRRLVFTDPSKRALLEAILHPMIHALSEERCRLAKSPYVILAVPLLIESGDYLDRCDRILVVDCDEAQQVERVVARSGLTEAEVRAIMATQVSRVERLAAAHDLIRNDSDLAWLDRQVADLHQLYSNWAASKAAAR